MKMIKKMLKEIAAAFIVATASAMVCVFLTQEITFFTVGLGIIGLLLLHPATEHYIKVIENLFKKKVGED